MVFLGQKVDVLKILEESAKSAYSQECWSKLKLAVCEHSCPRILESTEFH